MNLRLRPSSYCVPWLVCAALSCSGSNSGAAPDAGRDDNGGSGGSASSAQSGSGGQGGAPTNGGAGGAGGATPADAGRQQDAGRGDDAGGRGGTDAGDERSQKRGVAYDFCKADAQGQSDVVLLRAGITWYYNWGTTAGSCVQPDAEPSVEYVPMAWGLTNAGNACASGGVCFNDGLTLANLTDNIPPNARYLLGFNEPNFAHQSNLTPTVAARGWTHLEHVAKERKLALVGPATNYCDATPDADHAGSCTREPAEHKFHFADYDLTVPAGHGYNAFEWAELFYDECSAQGAAASDCQIDYQAGHVYSYWGLAWYVDVFKRKAGMSPASEAHCKNDTKDADEFNVDCGGNACAACTAWARAQFSKALWITEFAPSTDDGPSPRPSAPQLVEHASEYIRSELPKLEQDSYVFRYAWFMPRTDIASLDHVDLLSSDKPAKLTSVGVTYLELPH